MAGPSPPKRATARVKPELCNKTPLTIPAAVPAPTAPVTAVFAATVPPAVFTATVPPVAFVATVPPAVFTATAPPAALPSVTPAAGFKANQVP